MSALTFILGRPRFCLLLALLWLPLGLGMALATPWIALTPTWVVWAWNHVPLAVTAALVVWNLLAALRVVGLTGLPHRAWPYTLAQLALFTLLFFQIACHLGAEHYEVEQLPHWWDWGVFSVVHALRAGDLFDFLEAYGIDLQVINHAGLLTASCLLVFHLVLDLFFIAVLFQGIRRLLRRKQPALAAISPLATPMPMAPRFRLFLAFVLAGLVVGLGSLALHFCADYTVHPTMFAMAVPVVMVLILPLLAPRKTGSASFDGTRTLVWFTVVFLLVLVVSALWVRPWRNEDLYLWPIENLCHVLDVGDAMYLFEWKLSQVPKNLWEGSLTLVCRLLMGLALGGLISRLAETLSVRLLSGYGLPPETLAEIEQTTTNPRRRALVQQRLARLHAVRVPSAARGWGWGVLIGGVALGLALFAFLQDWPDWTGAAQRLAKPALSVDHPERNRALAGLRRLGPAAGSVAPVLASGLPQATPEHRDQLIETLTHLGPEGLAELGETLEWGNPALALACLPIVEARGPTLAPVLARGMASSTVEVAQAAEKAILGLGRASMPSLIATLSRSNVKYHAVLFERIDPQYWFRHSSSNPFYQELAAHQNWGFSDLSGVVRDRGWSSPSSEAIFRRTKDPDAGVRWQALLDLQRSNQISGQGLARSLELCADPDARVREQAHKNLQVLPYDVNFAELPGAKAALVPLVRRFGDANLEVSGGAYRALLRFQPNWTRYPEVLPVLLEWASAPELSKRRKAAQHLGEADRVDAERIVPVLFASLAEKDKEVRRSAIFSLGNFGPASSRAVPLLLLTLNGADPILSSAALIALGRIGPLASPARESMLEVLSHGDDFRVFRAAEALVQIDPSSGPLVVARLEELLVRPKNPISLRHLLSEAGSIGPATAPFLPRFLPLLVETRQQESDRGQVVYNLDRIDPNWRTSASLRALLPRWLIQYAGVDWAFSFNLDHTLKQLPKWQDWPEVEQAVPELAKLTRHPSVERRKRALRILVQMRPYPALTLTPLTESLNDPDSEVRGDAARAVGRMGSAARSVLPRLREMTKDPNSLLKSYAEQAIRRIEGKETVSDMP